MHDLKFEFTEQEIGYIFEVLKQRPYAECVNLINNIQAQYKMQQQQVEKEEKES